MERVRLEKFGLDDSQYHRGNEIWKASSLIAWCKAKEYPVFDMPLCGVNLSTEAFEFNTLDNFIFQMSRVQSCSLDYPIILDDLGQIADGYHRVCKAILQGRKTIKAIRMQEMPTHDLIENEDE